MIPAGLLTITAGEIDLAYDPGDVFSIEVALRNDSAIDLNSQGANPLHIAYHWLAPATPEVRVWEGLRTPLVPPLPAHSERSYRATVIAPDAPGDYRLQVTLVQEGVAWLDDRVAGVVAGRIVHIQRQAWWRAGARNVLFSANEELNKNRFSKYLSHRGAYRPIALFCETTNLCNNACVVCAYSRQSRPKGVMPMATFEKVLRDYSEMGGGHLSLTPVVGEAFLDHHLAERIRMAEIYPAIRSLSVTTNAGMVPLLGEAELRYMLTRLKRVLISVYGIDAAEHREITRRDTFDRTVDGINRILQCAVNEVALSFRLLFPRTIQEIRAWVEALVGFSRSNAAIIVQGPMYTYANWGVLDTRAALPGIARWREVPAQQGQCLIPLLGCQVFWDGDVSFCGCDDFDKAESLHLGSILRSSLAELYNGERARQLWDWKSHGVPPFCRNCSFYQPLDAIDRFGDLFSDPLLMAGA